MNRRSTLARTLTLLLAVAQLLLRPMAGLGDAADKREASARAMPVVHIEAQTDNGCARLHPADCLLCHTVFVPFTQSAAQPPLMVSYTSPARPTAPWQGVWASTDRPLRARPRAPPALS